MVGDLGRFWLDFQVPDGGVRFDYDLVSPPTGGVVLLTRQKYPKAF